MILGLTLVLGKLIELPQFLQNIFPVYIHLFIMGWINQLIFGVAWWLFPLLPDRKKGNEKLAYTLYFLLNLGLILRAIFEPLNSIESNNINNSFLLLSALIQVSAIFIFVSLLWNRVRGK
jgi:uncharacterized membrane protein